MAQWRNPATTASRASRRQFLRATGLGLVGAGLSGWLDVLAEQRADEMPRGRHCILLWMNGGPSQIDTFDMKPGRPTGGQFRPIQTNVNGVQICEYMPLMARMIDKLAIVRSMRTHSPDHPDGIYHMHTCYRMAERIPHPEIGAMVARYLGRPESDLPSFVRMGPCGNAGAGYLGPRFEPFSLDREGRLPYFSVPYLNVQGEQRRGDLLRFMEDGFGRDHQAEPFAAHRQSETGAWRLMRARSAFDVSRDWPAARARYGDTEFGKRCFMALRLAEAGVPFVEVGQDNYDSHADNFVCHKGNMEVLDPAWSALLQDLHDRSLLADTLVVWMGEVGRTPYINNRAGRDHYIRAWTIVLAGGGVRGGQVYGATDIDGREVTDKPVSEGDLFATIYTALGVNPRARHYVGTRPIWATPEGSHAVRELIA